ncbi:AMP-binding protein [Actinomadura roseirufa]|uniref:AMP-binding protein n=1 Tax=Actinomadura roseirufa TaxID=2094049 RepID=UPI001040F7E3|nr:AMP-binding protein [Actinomadura roseirufa]
MSIVLASEVHTLGDMFEFVAEHHPAGAIRSVFAEDVLTYAQLAEDGRRIAGGLIDSGVAPGEPVAVLIGSNLDMVRAICGLAAAGAVVVPLSVPLSVSRSYLERLEHVIADCGVRFALTDGDFAEQFGDRLPDITPLDLATLLEKGKRIPRPPVSVSDLALIQYTSGSTSEPRGVALDHRNILEGIRNIQRGVDVRPGDVLGHWLPLSHDMGLFSTLSAIASGVDARLSRPQDFVKHPEEWLQSICAAGVTVMAGPSFFYEYLMEAVPRDEAEEFDLSAVRVMINGAEPIAPELVLRFEEHFSVSGLGVGVMTPSYGLAEATLAVSFTALGSPARVDWVDRDVLNNSWLAKTVDPAAQQARGVVSCGVPVPGMEIRISSEDGRLLPERAVGEIEIRGETVMRGYYRRSEPAANHDGWCATGDLGYLADSELYVTGRKKEMMILGGQNYYPQDVEDAVRDVPGVHKGNAVAVVLPADPETGRAERIGVLAEAESAAAPHDELVSALRAAAAETLGGALADVVLLRRNALLRTTSGKYKRLLMRQRLLEGTLNRVLVHVGAHETVTQRSEPSLL